MKKNLSPLWVILLLLGTACNKEVEQVPVPPFTIFPNPFVEDFVVHLDNILPSNQVIAFRILDGKNDEIAVWETPQPGSSIYVNMIGREKALYYAELQVGNEVFIQPIIKSE